MALAKNFTGPTMGRMPPLIDPPVPGLDLPMRAAAMPIQYQPSRRLILLGRMSQVALDPPCVEIPPPPLGKLIFSTFPAVYKSRQSAPTTGRISPRRTR